MRTEKVYHHNSILAGALCDLPQFYNSKWFLPTSSTNTNFLTEALILATHGKCLLWSQRASVFAKSGKRHLKTKLNEHVLLKYSSKLRNTYRDSRVVILSSANGVRTDSRLSRIFLQNENNTNACSNMVTGVATRTLSPLFPGQTTLECGKR